MKHLFYGALGAVLLLALATGCTAKAQRITVALDNEAMDSIEYLYVSLAGQTKTDREQPVSGMAGRDVDQGGVFTIEMPNDNNTYAVWIYQKGVPAISPKHFVQTTLLPGEKIHLDVKVEAQMGALEYTLTGSPVLEAEQVHRKASYGQMEGELEGLVMTYEIIQNETTKQNVRTRIDQLTDSITKIKAGYISEHPDEMLSGLYVAKLQDPYLTDSLYNLLGEVVKESNLKELLGFAIKNAREQIAVQDNRKAVEAEGKAVDFTLKDMDGKDFTLSSLYGKGKYIVLDFWGAWCGWCVKGFPDMKAAYGRYAGKLEIVGIDCGDTEKAWKDAVKKHELPWIQVRSGGTQGEGGTDAPTVYGVDGFPTKIILSPQGAIVARIVGESPEFYEKLDELLK